jgi:hypothetical protein
MRARARVLLLLLFVLSLTAYPTAALGAALPTVAPRQVPTIVTMRLGISAGDAIQNVKRGTDRRALERIIPELFQTANTLGVRIDEVSVGRGFWSEDDKIESENDLDLVVTGLRENVLALGATLGDRWGQSSVLAWEMTVTGEMLTASLNVTAAVEPFDEKLFQDLATVLTDGGHLRYASDDSMLTLAFVAHTGDDSDDEFKARMAEAQHVLQRAGLNASAPIFAQADMTEISKDTYQQFIDGAVRGKAD